MGGANECLSWPMLQGGGVKMDKGAGGCWGKEGGAIYAEREGV